MAFSNQNTFGMSGRNAAQGTVNRVDSSILGKIRDAGYIAIQVSTDPSSFLRGTTDNQLQVMPGIALSGYQSTDGRFFVVDENNIVYNLNFVGVATTQTTDAGTPTTIVGSPNPANQPIISTVLPGSTIQEGGPGGPRPNPLPPSTPPPAPPSNLGSGKIFSMFEPGDVVPNQQETITRAMWSGNVGNLLTYFTSSNQTSTSKRYYYEIYNSGSGDCGAQPQFSLAWGHKQGSGSADEGGQINDTPSRAIYGQYKQLCLEPGEERFTISGIAEDSIYVVNVNRARMREYVDEGNVELCIQSLSGSQFLAGGGKQNAHTGSNVRIFPTQRVIRLVDDSRINSATITSAGEVYKMVSGSIEDGVFNSSSPHEYGLLYRRLGVIVLSGTKLDMSSSFLTVTGSEIPGDNAYKLFMAVSGAARYTDASGDYLGFQARSAEKVKSTHYFVRARNQDYNFSNNPTFVTGSEGDLMEPTFIGDPQTYITTVGLYNPAKELIAVAKLNQPIRKNFYSEALIKVKLEF